MKSEAITYRTIRPTIRLVVLFFVGALLAACSDDSETRKELVTVELMPCAPSFLEVEPIAYSRKGWPMNDTRADDPPAGDTPTPWTPPTNFFTYEVLNSKFTNQFNLVDQTIGIFFTQNGIEPTEDRCYLNKSGKWRTTKELEETSYYLYGFIPSVSGMKASISSSSTANDHSNYSNGAVLTLEDMPTVTASDVCVIVGAKDGKAENDDNGLTLGQFEFKANATDDVDKHNYIFLLFDHIYSSLRFSLKVDNEYDKLRTILLKKMVLRVSEKNIGVTNRANVTITLQAHQLNPIESVNFTYTNTHEEPDPIFKSDDGLKLTTTASDFMGSFVPQDINSFTLESTYDVYDKQNHVIRKNCKAENHLSINDLFYPLDKLEPGKMFAVNLTIEPTYLYMLGDPDLDNPSIKIEH